MSAESSKKKRQDDAAKGLTRLELYGVHPDDREAIKALALKLKAERLKKGRPSRCDECSHMGRYGHGEPPDCMHPSKGNVGLWEFANPRGTPPAWCPLTSVYQEVQGNG